MVIQVKIKNVYGNETIYPVCDKAKIFARMVGQKSLTMTEIQNIKALGYTVQVVQEVKGL